MGWLIALAVVILLAILPLGVSAIYDAGGPLVRLIVGPVRIQVYPSVKKGGGKEKKPKKAKKETAAKPAAAKSKPKSGGSITDFLPLVRVVLDFLEDFRRKLRVNRLELKIILGGGDPCDLAVNYGKAWAAMGNLIPQLERAFVIKKRDMEVECDFTASSTTVLARLDLTITLGRILTMGVRHAIHGLREFMKINKLRKGGAVK